MGNRSLRLIGIIAPSQKYAGPLDFIHQANYSWTTSWWLILCFMYMLIFCVLEVEISEANVAENERSSIVYKKTDV